MTTVIFLVSLVVTGLLVWIIIRQHQENALQSRVIEATNCGVLVTDATLPHHPIISSNPAFRLLTGYAEYEVLGQTTAMLAGPETDRASIEKLGLALQDGRACRVSLRHYRKNGTSFWNDVTLSPVEDQTGRVRSVVWVMSDISPLRQGGAELQKMPSPTFLCDVVSEGVFVTTDSEIVYINSAGLNILGAASAEQLVGGPWMDFVCEELQEAVRLWIVQRVAFSYSKSRLETKFVRCDGREVVVELSVAPMTWEGKESVLVCFSAVPPRNQVERQSTHGRYQIGQPHAIEDSHVWKWSIGSGTEMWSEEQYRLLGHEPGSVPPTYETFKKVLHPDDRERVLTLVEETFTSDRPYDIECRIIQPGGDVRFVRCRGVLIRGASDQAIRMSGTIEDITDYKLVAAMAEERDLQFKAVMESVSSGILLVRQDGTISLANSHVQRMFGYPCEELLGRPMECLLSAPDREKQRETRAACFAQVGLGAKDGSYEVQGLRKDGSAFPLHIRLVPVHQSKGKGVIAIMGDLAVRQQTEQALEEIQTQLDLAIQSGRIGIFEHDHLTDAHLWSPILREICGVSAEEGPSFNRYLELVHPGDRERMRIEVFGTANQGMEAPYTGEHRLVRPDGAVRHIGLRTRTWFDSEGDKRRPTRTVGLVVDVTDHVNTTMVMRVVEEMESMRAMTGGIAHELNNSLTAVLGFSELALGLIPTENKAHRHISQVIAAGRKAREVAHRIRRTLDHTSSYPITRVASLTGGQDPSTESIEVSDVVGPRS